MASWIRESEIFTSADTSGDDTSRSRRVADLIGLACLVAAFVLLSSGVRLARADVFEVDGLMGKRDLFQLVGCGS